MPRRCVIVVGGYPVRMLEHRGEFLFSDGFAIFAGPETRLAEIAEFAACMAERSPLITIPPSVPQIVYETEAVR